MLFILKFLVYLMRPNIIFRIFAPLNDLYYLDMVKSRFVAKNSTHYFECILEQVGEPYTSVKVFFVRVDSKRVPPRSSKFPCLLFQTIGDVVDYFCDELSVNWFVFAPYVKR